MSDFSKPNLAYHQHVFITTLSPHVMLGDRSLTAGNSHTAVVWPAANRAILVPFQVEIPFVARRMALFSGAASGNADIGLYDEKFNRIVTKGSFVVSGVAVRQSIDITASVTGTASPTLNPGTYFMALCVDNTTATIGSVAPATLDQQVCGVQIQGLGSVTLTATITPSNHGATYVPYIAVTSATVI
jgi:hypothetical protein